MHCAETLPRSSGVFFHPPEGNTPADFQKKQHAQKQTKRKQEHGKFMFHLEPHALRVGFDPLRFAPGVRMNRTTAKAHVDTIASIVRANADEIIESRKKGSLSYTAPVCIGGPKDPPVWSHLHSFS